MPVSDQKDLQCRTACSRYRFRPAFHPLCSGSTISPRTSGSAGTPRSVSCSASSIPRLWRKVEGSPRLFLRSVDQSILDHAAADPSFIDEYRRIVAAFDDYLGGKPPPHDGLERGRPHRVLLRRVRLARELPDLLGRLGRARRRSLQDGQRSESAVRRGGPACIGTAIFISASTATASRSPTTRRSIRAARRSSIAH